MNDSLDPVNPFIDGEDDDEVLLSGRRDSNNNDQTDGGVLSVLGDDEFDDEDELLPEIDFGEFNRSRVDNDNDDDDSSHWDLIDGEDEDDVNYDDFVKLDIERGLISPDDVNGMFGESDFDAVLKNSLGDDFYDDSSNDFSDGSLSVGGDEDSLGDDSDLVGVYESDDFSSVDESRAELFESLSNALSNDDDDEDDEEEDADDGLSMYDSSSSSLNDLLGLSSNDDDDDDSSFYSDEDDDFSSSAHLLDIDKILSRAIDLGASDVYIKPDDEVAFKILGKLTRFPEFGILGKRQVSNAYREITLNVAQDDFLKKPEMDTSYNVQSGIHLGRRLRLSVGKTFDSHYMVFRVISDTIPSPDEIGMNEKIRKWASLPNGLILINGPTGVGKSTTLASLIREIQMTREDTIVTIEKPVEYVYGVAGKAEVIQREVGRDTNSFSDGLDSAMRQSPNVILIGEIRNQDEVNAVLYAAETGHLAFSTMHTNSAAHTLNRIKRLFKGDEQIRVLADLSEVVRGFANQLLVSSPDGKSRSSVNEVLEVDDTVREFMLNGDVRGITQYQEQLGTTMEHELVKAVLDKRCTVDEARRVTSFRDRLDRILKDEGLL